MLINDKQFNQYQQTPHREKKKKRAGIAFNDLLKRQVLLSRGVAHLSRANIFLNFKIY
jgi:hypothetical protein